MQYSNIPLEYLLAGGNGSVYKLTILAAKRAMQLADGEKAMIEKPQEKVLDNALREISEGMIKVNEKEKKEK